MKQIFENPKLNEEEARLLKFNSFFPDGKMKNITMAKLPPAVLDYFEENSQKFILPEQYQPGNFKGFSVVDYSNGDKTYIANQLKIYNSKENNTEDLNYIIDYRGEEKIDHSELRYNLSEDEYFRDKPFVGYNGTEEGYQRTGLGERRLFLMNALAKTLYNHPLNSDTLISPEAINLWEKLIKDHKAKKTKEGENDRYVMTI